MFLTALLGCALAVDPGYWNLYDARHGSMPQESPWYWGLVGTGGVVTPPDGSSKVTLDTTSLLTIQEGWLNVAPVPILIASGPRVSFDVRLRQESHANSDRAGLSVIVLADDKLGVEISFWPDRVWIQNDSPLFTHGEEAWLDTGAAGSGVGGLRHYDLFFRATGYELRVDGATVLSGIRRDYTAFSGSFNPYVIPNVLWVGDDTKSASAVTEFSRFTVSCGSRYLTGGQRVGG